ncbi:acylneuraminate cytidylyltransferase [Bacteroides helcogenes]|uniref:N-acylneuraminate cytidylyltransferase n=1 Tax=Bacteroides helcogenes (strain ATCC 35417 / DSM 20613 / JCM 6297 / CCUG 15421 / P 36-108) TaxID=693979 RepID=E6SS55_BACT6|nr:acylneuraminate cytidylyltransferase [Bacteroides helcogenes]ADV44123.1 3-deoxy-D-manno-octulosonate 8-phosphate phosphatase, YrbI family [Bacteroides helcogenes P 36-108]MDY5237945.1 acylneuraminate cytidylyltransferase [Bacteroides helcogenes]
MKTIAFIPVRGGSKSIPLKNIKPFCGKPLVCWNIEALESCPLVDEIIIATDSDKIENIIVAQSYKKTTIYRRSAENASDTASTESVMLEYIDYANLNESDIFMLVQATSPLTETHHFTEALSMYGQNKYDSMLTCVRNYRFFWHEDGTSMNYDYCNRPRRQNFAGMLMENGAFYINMVKNILENRNRLSGDIGIYEMPQYTAIEIDEPDDWIVLEKLMQKYVLSKIEKSKKVKLFISDVDGTLTDGGMYYAQTGYELKKFNTRDGMGFQLLREAGIKTGIITSENTRIIDNRAKKLKIDYLIQGKRGEGKLEAAMEVCNQEGISLDEVAYIGDDINCYKLLDAVGIKACPADACEKVKQIDGILLMDKKGGEGCVREFAEKIINAIE